MPTVMSVKNAKLYLRLVHRWGGVCIICGEPFTHLACVTKEHVRPYSMGGTKSMHNIAPSHYSCNTSRGTKSLLEASKMIRKKLARIPPAHVNAWLNKNVPGRIVPECALVPINDAGWFF